MDDKLALRSPTGTLMPAWERAMLMTRQRYERLVTQAVGLSGGTVVTLVALAMHPGTVALAVAGALGVGAAGAWAAVWRANTGSRRRLREAYEAWLLAETQEEAVRGLAVAYRGVGHRAIAQAAGPDGLDAWFERLRQAAKAEGVLIDDARLWAVEEESRVVCEVKTALVRAELLEVEAREARAREEFERLRLESERWRCESERLRVERPVLRAPVAETLVRPDKGASTLVYPQPGQRPSMPQEVEVAAMRREVANAEREADEGKVIESHAAGVILSEPARWSAYAAPFHLSKELMELFDPSNEASTAARSSGKR